MRVPAGSRVLQLVRDASVGQPRKALETQWRPRAVPRESLASVRIAGADADIGVNVEALVLTCSRRSRPATEALCVDVGRLQCPARVERAEQPALRTEPAARFQRVRLGRDIRRFLVQPMNCETLAFQKARNLLVHPLCDRRQVGDARRGTGMESQTTFDVVHRVNVHTVENDHMEMHVERE